MPNEFGRQSRRISEAGGEIRFAQAYLERYGYLASESYKTDALDESTKLAISRFQRFFGLNLSGEPDESTLKVMTLARCGLPDPLNRSRFIARCAWTAAIPIRFTFLGGSSSVSDDNALAAVQNAISSWHPADIPNVPGFQQVDPEESPDLLITWLKMDPDLGFTPEIYAHSDFPSPCHVIDNPPPPTPLHFNDQDFEWTDNPVPGLVDIESVALHELGHVLGLEHSAVVDAVMFPTLGLGDSRRAMTQDDREGLLSLYS